MALVYKVTSPSGKIYIGYTTKTLGRRKAIHYCDNPHLYFHKALKKYSKSEMLWEIIIDNLSVEEALEKERELILYYESYKPTKGYNSTMGGESGFLTPESLEKMKQTKLKSGPSEKQLIYSKRMRTSEEKLKISLAQGGYLFNVYKKDSGEYVGTFINRMECTEILKLSKGKVSLCLQGHRKSHKGYIFKKV